MNLTVKALAILLICLSGCVLRVDCWETEDKIIQYMTLFCSQNVLVMNLAGHLPPTHLLTTYSPLREQPIWREQPVLREFVFLIHTDGIITSWKQYCRPTSIDS